MELKHFRNYIAIVDAGSISRAASLVNIAQPALSQQLMTLEAELGVKLLQRSSLGVVPTTAGARFYRHAQTILRQVEAARAAAASEETISGHVSVGLPTSAAVLLSVPLLAAARHAHPSVTLTIFESMSGYLEELLAANRLDMAILYRDQPARGIDVHPFLVESLYLLSGRGQRLEDDMDMREMRDRPMVLPSAKHSLRSLIERSFGRIGISLNVVADLDSLPTLRAAAERGIADTILPLSSIRSGVGSAAMSVRKLVHPGISRPVALCRPKALPSGDAAAAVAGLLASEINRLMADGTWEGAVYYSPGAP